MFLFFHWDNGLIKSSGDSRQNKNADGGIQLKVLPLIMILGGCYVVPMDWQGNPVWPTPRTAYGLADSLPSAPQKAGLSRFLAAVMCGVGEVIIH